MPGRGSAKSQDDHTRQHKKRNTSHRPQHEEKKDITRFQKIAKLCEHDSQKSFLVAVVDRKGILHAYAPQYMQNFVYDPEDGLKKLVEQGTIVNKDREESKKAILKSFQKAADAFGRNRLNSKSCVILLRAMEYVKTLCEKWIKFWDGQVDEEDLEGVKEGVDEEDEEEGEEGEGEEDEEAGEGREGDEEGEGRERGERGEEGEGKKGEESEDRTDGKEVPEHMVELKDAFIDLGEKDDTSTTKSRGKGGKFLGLSFNFSEVLDVSSWKRGPVSPEMLENRHILKLDDLLRIDGTKLSKLSFVKRVACIGIGLEWLDKSECLCHPIFPIFLLAFGNACESV